MTEETIEQHLLISRMIDREMKPAHRFMERCISDILQFLNSEELCLDTYLGWGVSRSKYLQPASEKSLSTPYFMALYNNYPVYEVLLTAMASGSKSPSERLLKNCHPERMYTLDTDLLTLIKEILCGIKDENILNKWVTLVPDLVIKEFLEELKYVSTLFAIRDVHVEGSTWEWKGRDGKGIAVISKLVELGNDSDILNWALTYPEDVPLLSELRSVFKLPKYK